MGTKIPTISAMSANRFSDQYTADTHTQFPKWESLQGVGYEQNNEELLLKMKVNGVVRPISLLDYSTLSHEHPEYFRNCMVLDPHKCQKYIFDEQGYIIEEEDINMDEYEELEFESPINVIGRIHNIDKNVKEQEVALKTTRKKITFEELLNVIKNPVIHKFNIPTVKSNMDALIACILKQPSHFDELFTTEVDRPESPLMRKYLTELARLVNIELEKSDEVNNIEDLEKLAYAEANYEGKDLQIVLNEAKDYKSYYRFLLMKGERIVITEKEKEYADKLLSITKELKHNNHKTKKTKLNFEIEAELDGSSVFYFSEKVDTITIGSPIVIELHTYVPTHISQIEKHIGNKDIDLRIALINEIITKQFKTDEKNISISLFVCDKNYNHGTFKISKSTLLKWKKKLLGTLVNKLDNVVTIGCLPQTIELSDFSI